MVTLCWVELRKIRHDRTEMLRGLLVGLPTNLALDFGVLANATTAAITVASLLLPRLAR